MRRIAMAVWDFVAGDDPLVALGVAVALGITAAAAAAGASAWWIMPTAVVMLLAHSLWRASRPR